MTALVAPLFTTADDVPNRRPLPRGRVYHFNVIYNHARSALSNTEDTQMTLDWIRKAVEKLQLQGLVNSYYHDRDCTKGQALAHELDRVIAGSEVTVVVLSPGFVKDCWSRFLYISSFRSLFTSDSSSATSHTSSSFHGSFSKHSTYSSPEDDPYTSFTEDSCRTSSSRSVLSSTRKKHHSDDPCSVVLVALGLDEPDLPAVLKGKEVLFFTNDWQKDQAAWERLQGSLLSAVPPGDGWTAREHVHTEQSSQLPGLSTPLATKTVPNSFLLEHTTICPEKNPLNSFSRKSQTRWTTGTSSTDRPALYSDSRRTVTSGQTQYNGHSRNPVTSGQTQYNGHSRNPVTSGQTQYNCQTRNPVTSGQMLYNGHIHDRVTSGQTLYNGSTRDQMTSRQMYNGHIHNTVTSGQILYNGHTHDTATSGQTLYNGHTHDTVTTRNPLYNRVSNNTTTGHVPCTRTSQSIIRAEHIQHNDDCRRRVTSVLPSSLQTTRISDRGQPVPSSPQVTTLNERHSLLLPLTSTSSTVSDEHNRRRNYVPAEKEDLCSLENNKNLSHVQQYRREERGANRMNAVERQQTSEVRQADEVNYADKKTDLSNSIGNQGYVQRKKRTSRFKESPTRDRKTNNTKGPWSFSATKDTTQLHDNENQFLKSTEDTAEPQSLDQSRLEYSTSRREPQQETLMTKVCFESTSVKTPTSERNQDRHIQSNSSILLAGQTSQLDNDRKQETPTRDSATENSIAENMKQRSSRSSKMSRQKDKKGESNVKESQTISIQPTISQLLLSCKHLASSSAFSISPGHTLSEERDRGSKSFPEHRIPLVYAIRQGESIISVHCADVSQNTETKLDDSERGRIVSEHDTRASVKSTETSTLSSQDEINTGRETDGIPGQSISNVKLAAVQSGHSLERESFDREHTQRLESKPDSSRTKKSRLGAPMSVSKVSDLDVDSETLIRNKQASDARFEEHIHPITDQETCTSDIHTAVSKPDLEKSPHKTQPLNHKAQHITHTRRSNESSLKSLDCVNYKQKQATDSHAPTQPTETFFTRQHHTESMAVPYKVSPDHKPEAEANASKRSGTENLSTADRQREPLSRLNAIQSTGAFSADCQSKEQLEDSVSKTEEDCVSQMDDQEKRNSSWKTHISTCRTEQQKPEHQTLHTHSLIDILSKDNREESMSGSRDLGLGRDLETENNNQTIRGQHEEESVAVNYHQSETLPSTSAAIYHPETDLHQAQSFNRQTGECVHGTENNQIETVAVLNITNFDRSNKTEKADSRKKRIDDDWTIRVRSDDDGATGTRPGDDVATGTRSDDARATGTRSDDDGATGTRSDDDGTTGTRSDDARATGTRSDDDGATGTRSDDGGAIKTRSDDDKVTGTRSDDDGATKTLSDDDGAIRTRSDDDGATTTRLDDDGPTTICSDDDRATGTRSAVDGATKTRSDDDRVTETRSDDGGATTTRSDDVGITGTGSAVDGPTATRSDDVGITGTGSAVDGPTTTRSDDDRATTTRSDDDRVTGTRSDDDRVTGTRSGHDGAITTRSDDVGITGTRSVDDRVIDTCLHDNKNTFSHSNDNVITEICPNNDEMTEEIRPDTFSGMSSASTSDNNTLTSTIMVQRSQHQTEGKISVERETLVSAVSILATTVPDLGVGERGTESHKQDLEAGSSVDSVESQEEKSTLTQTAVVPVLTIPTNTTLQETPGHLIEEHASSVKNIQTTSVSPSTVINPEYEAAAKKTIEDSGHEQRSDGSDILTEDTQRISALDTTLLHTDGLVTEDEQRDPQSDVKLSITVPPVPVPPVPKIGWDGKKTDYHAVSSVEDFYAHSLTECLSTSVTSDYETLSPRNDLSGAGNDSGFFSGGLASFGEACTATSSPRVTTEDKHPNVRGSSQTSHSMSQMSYKACDVVLPDRQGDHDQDYVDKGSTVAESYGMSSTAKATITTSADRKVEGLTNTDTDSAASTPVDLPLTKASQCDQPQQRHLLSQTETIGYVTDDPGINGSRMSAENIQPSSHGKEVASPPIETSDSVGTEAAAQATGSSEAGITEGATRRDSWKYEDVDEGRSAMLPELYRIMCYALSKPEMPYF